MNSEPTIAETAGLCFNAFQQCLEKSAFTSPREMSRVEDQFARFSLWTANIGVFALGRASLDHRLREAQEVHEVIAGLLEALDDKINECTSYLKSFIEPEGDDAQGVDQERLDKHIQGLANQITLLHRLSNTIRKASSETQNTKAANTFRILDDEGNDVEPLLEIIFANYVRDKFRSIDEKVLQRLVRAMITRRKRVLYKRSRFGNLAVRVRQTKPRPKVQTPQTQPQQAPTIQGLSQAEQNKDNDDLKEDEIGPNYKSQAGISATTLAADKFKKASAPSVISGTKTVAFDNHEDLPFPVPPLGRVRRKYKKMKRALEDRKRSDITTISEKSKPADMDMSDYQVKADIKLSRELNECWDQCLRAVGEVTCPFCFYAILALDISDDNKWRSHVRNDLDAYICLFEQCNDQDRLFGHSEEWLRHMREHALRWPCNSKSHGTIVFDSREEYIDHLKQAHKNTFSDAQLRVLADRNARTIGPLFTSCPFCGFEDTSNGTKIEDHIVGHLRFLALKSLPPYEDERSESSNAESTSSRISKPRKRSTVENDPDKQIKTDFEDHGPIILFDSEDESVVEPGLTSQYMPIRRNIEWGFVTEAFDEKVNVNDDIILQHIAAKQAHESSAGWNIPPEEIKHFRKKFLDPHSLDMRDEQIASFIVKDKLWMKMPFVDGSRDSSKVKLSEIDDDAIRFDLMKTMAAGTDVPEEIVRISHDNPYLIESRRNIREGSADQMTVIKTDQDERSSDEGKHKIVEVTAEGSSGGQFLRVPGGGSDIPSGSRIRTISRSSEKEGLTKLRNLSEVLPSLNDLWSSADPIKDESHRKYMTVDVIDRETPLIPVSLVPPDRGRSLRRTTSAEGEYDSSLGIQDLNVTTTEPERRRETYSPGTRPTQSSSNYQTGDSKDQTPVVGRREVDHISEIPNTGEIPNAVPRQGIAGNSILVNQEALIQQSNLPNLDDGVLDDMIQRLLASPGSSSKTLCINNDEITTICAVSRELFLSQPMLLELKAPVKIAGDIHGQYTDLLRMFELSGYPPNENYLFLGDYVDRGKSGLETILLLLCYKLKYPENFFLLRGNHECANVTRVYGFYDECKRRCNIKIWKTFIDVFNCLPVAAIVSDKIFCVHGGLSPSLAHMNDVRAIVRPTDVPDYGLLNDLLWSDPAEMDQDWETNERGVSYVFGKNVIREFLTKFDFDLICRAHMVVEDGYEFYEDRLLVTIFTAPNYCGEFDNWGAIMAVSEDLLCSFELLKPLSAEAKPIKAAKSLTANIRDRWKKWTTPSAKWDSGVYLITNEGAGPCSETDS